MARIPTPNVNPGMRALEILSPAIVSDAMAFGAGRQRVLLVGTSFSRSPEQATGYCCGPQGY